MKSFPALLLKAGTQQGDAVCGIDRKIARSAQRAPHGWGQRLGWWQPPGCAVPAGSGNPVCPDAALGNADAQSKPREEPIASNPLWPPVWRDFIHDESSECTRQQEQDWLNAPLRISSVKLRTASVVASARKRVHEQVDVGPIATKRRKSAVTTRTEERGPRGPGHQPAAVRRTCPSSLHKSQSTGAR